MDVSWLWRNVRDYSHVISKSRELSCFVVHDMLYN